MKKVATEGRRQLTSRLREISSKIEDYDRVYRSKDVNIRKHMVIASGDTLLAAELQKETGLDVWSLTVLHKFGRAPYDIMALAFSKEDEIYSKSQKFASKANNALKRAGLFVFSILSFATVVIPVLGGISHLKHKIAVAINKKSANKCIKRIEELKTEAKEISDRIKKLDGETKSASVKQTTKSTPKSSAKYSNKKKITGRLNTNSDEIIK